MFRAIANFFMMISDFLYAITSDNKLDFKNTMLRFDHMRNGHPFDERECVVDKLKSEKHPHSSDEMIYTVNLVKCKCGMIYHDDGLEYRDRSWISK